MVEPLPALELIAETIRHERDLLFRHADSLDTKAGVVLGAGAAGVALIAGNFSTWMTPALAMALLSNLVCLSLFRPTRFPIWKVRGLRDRLLRSDLVFARIRIADTELAMTEQASHTLTSSARRLAWAVWLLYAAGLLAAGSSLVEYWRR